MSACCKFRREKLGRVTKPIPVLDEIEWRAPGLEPVPLGQPGDWPRNEFLPRVGEMRWAFRVFSTLLKAGDRVWFLFEPLAAVFNGLGHEPVHMDEAAVVEVEIMERRFFSPVLYPFAPSPTDRDWSWMQVRCLQVIHLWDIPNHFEQTEPLKEFYFPLRKGAEADKIVEMWVGQEGYSDAYYLTKTVPPRAVLRIFDCVNGERERSILNSEWQLIHS